jgi:hypothetical protein
LALTQRHLSGAFFFFEGDETVSDIQSGAASRQHHAGAPGGIRAAFVADWEKSR